MSGSDNAHPNQGVVDRYFGGDCALFDSYLMACRQQFSVDVQDGESACCTGDWARLRRTAHNLRSVLVTLGEPGLSAQAARCEDASQHSESDVARASWRDLSLGLSQTFSL